MTEFVDGIDVSRWQGRMDWGVAESAGAQYAFIRAANGLDEDIEFQRNADLAPDYMLVGYYQTWWSGIDPVAQAEFFWDLVRNKSRNFRLVASVEYPGSEVYLESYLIRLIELSGEVPIEYTRGSLWNPYYADLTPSLFGDLWVARYHNLLDHPWGDNKYQPDGWHDWHFWQWSADGNNQGARFGAESRDIDLDRFNGTYEDLLTYADLVEPSTCEDKLARIQAILDE